MAQVNSADGLLLFFVAFPCPCNSSVAKIGPNYAAKFIRGRKKNMRQIGNPYTREWSEK
jgi:hypothetical protein